jgi:hypothetical protein
MKAFLQIFHFILLFLVIISGGVLYYYSIPGETFRNGLELLGFLLFIIWPVVVVVIGVIKKETIEKTTFIIGAYRYLLMNAVFLYLSDLILAFSLTICTSFLLTTRQVEFRTNSEATLRIFIDTDNTENDEEVGIATRATPLKKRLKTANYEIYYKSNDFSNGKTISVPSVFASYNTVVFYLDN